MEEKLRLLEKSKKEIERYNYYLNSGIPIDEIQNTKDYILSNEHLMKLYGEKNPLTLTAKYLKKVRELRRDLNSRDDYQYLANILEYFRFMCMRDNIEGVIPGMAFLENLSDSKFSSILLGKSSSEGQVAAIVDVLSNRLNVSMDNVGYYIPEDSSKKISNFTCLRINTPTGKHYIDTYHYNGKMSVPNKLTTRNYINNIYPLVIEDKTLKKARKRVAKYLIKKLNIMSIISKLELNGLSEKEMNDKFIEYIKNNQDNYDGIEVNANTIMVSGELMETSRLLELFYIATGIRYRVKDNKKENSTFEVVLDEEITTVNLEEESKKFMIK